MAVMILVSIGSAPGEEFSSARYIPRLTTADPENKPIPWAEDTVLPIVPVMIDGQGPFRFLVDTGASHVVLDRRLAERLHLKQLDVPHDVHTAANVTETSEQSAVIATLGVGGTHFYDLLAHVYDFTRMEIDGDAQIQIEGILGSSLFAHTLLTLDFPQRTLQVAAGKLPEPDGKEIFPVRMIGRVPHVLIRLETGKESQERWMLIDSGSDGTLVVSSQWGLTYSHPIIPDGLSMTASGPRENRSTRIERMLLGSYAFAGPPVSVDDVLVHPRVGQGLLKGFRLTLDLAGHRIRYQTAQHAVAFGPAWSHGFTTWISRRAGHEARIVSWIAPGSPAGERLQLGDRVVMINGQEMAHLTPRAYALLKSKSHALELSVVRGATTLQIPIAAFDRLPWKPRDATSDAPAVSAEADAAAARVFALFALGQAYFYGHGLAKDPTKAIACFEQAAAHGDAGAQNFLGGLLGEGRLLPRNHAAARDWFRKAAEQGDANAQRNLGQIHANGEDVPVDTAQALAWFRKAAAQGDATAQHMLGRYHGGETGVAPDDSQAFIWHRKAAEQGHVDSQVALGLLYANGRGVARDELIAFRWIQKAAEQGQRSAQQLLGQMYLMGMGIAKDEATGVAWYRKAAEQNDPDAQVTLGLLYATGRGVAQNEATALMWLRKAADQGNVTAQVTLGEMYREGQGVAKDEDAAVSWFRKAADQGDASAQSSMGWAYAEGRGVAQDLRKACAWYGMAAEQGHAVAQYRLGMMYANGRGVQHDPVKTVKWMRLSAEQGHADAQMTFGIMHSRGMGVPQDDQLAAMWYLRAAEQGHARAQAALAAAYAEGRGVPKDAAQARSWLQKAAAQGHAGARQQLDAFSPNDATPP